MSLIDVPLLYCNLPLSLNPHNQHHSFSGEAEAILARAKATAEGLARVSQSLKENGGPEVSFIVFLFFFNFFDIYSIYKNLHKQC